MSNTRLTVPSLWEKSLMKFRSQLHLSDAALRQKIAERFNTRQLKTQLLNSAALIENNKATIKKLKQRALKLKDEQLSLQRLNETIACACIEQMKAANLKSVKNRSLEVVLKKTQSKVVITDENKIRPKFLKKYTLCKLNKALIKAALLNGQKVKGAELADVESLHVQP